MSLADISRLVVFPGGTIPSGGVSSGDLAAAVATLSGEIDATAVIRLTNVGGTAQAATADTAAAASGVAITDGTLFAGYYPAVNTGADPTMTVAGVTYTLKRYNGSAFAAGELTNSPYLWRRQSSSVWRLIGSVSIGDIVGLRAELDALAATDADQTADIATLENDVIDLQASDAANTKDIATLERQAVLAGAIDPRDTIAEDVIPLAIDADGRAVGVSYDGWLVTNGVEVVPDGDRDTLTEFIDAGQGNDGLAWGLRADGSVEIFDQTVTPPTERDTATEYLPVITDNTGAVAMGLTEDGLPVALEWVQHVDWDRDRVADGVPVISGRDGVAMSLDPETGLMRNGAPFTGPMYYPPADMRGNWGQFHVRPGGTHTYATVQTRGYICDVMQRLDLKVRNTAVAVGDIETWLEIGQSNAGPGSGPVGGPPITVSDWPHHVFDIGVYGVYGGSSAQTDMNATYDIRPATEPSGYGQTPLMMAALALADLEHNDGERVTARVTFTSWEGGRNLSDFFPGAGRFIHENAVFGLQAMHRICAQGYVAPTLTAVVFVQGENLTAGYQAEFESWIDDVLPLYGDAVGQPTPHLLFRQINIGSDASSIHPNDVGAAQLAVARDRMGDGVTLVGPMYQHPIHDNIHDDNLGRMMGGEEVAHAWRVQQGGDDWHPLWPVAGGVTRVGAVITIPMILPPGCYEMLFDDDWVPATPNRGFVYSDASSGATISTVEIDGANIVITLSANPGAAANKTIRYAQYNPPQVVGWAGARGQLYCDTYAPSPYYLRGFAVPPTIRAYCARFTETLV